MQKALFFKKGAVAQMEKIDPTRLMFDHGWQIVPSKEQQQFLTFRRHGKSTRIFIYEGGEWQEVGNKRDVLHYGPDMESLETYLTGIEKPYEHQG